MKPDLTPAEVRELLTEDQKKDFDKGWEYGERVFSLYKSLAVCRKEKEEMRALIKRAHSFLRWLDEETCWRTLFTRHDISTLISDLARLIRKEADDG